jgi:aryl-alcohol dehydrogenase-like predicted oxidoreductase
VPPCGVKNRLGCLQGSQVNWMWKEYSMDHRTIGDRQVSELGYGAMYLSVQGRPSEEQALETLRTVVENGVTLIDTADAYCFDTNDTGHNERLIAKAIKQYAPHPSRLLVATKGGHFRPGGAWDVNGRPEYLKRACEASLKALGVETINLYQFHRPDPKVPYAESIGAFSELLAEGKIRRVGLSNVSVEQIKIAQEQVPVVSVQNEYSHWHRHDDHNGVLQYCEQQGIAYLPWSPFGGGGRAKHLGEVPGIAAVAARHRVSPYRIVLAWLLKKSPVIIPIPCSTRSAGVLDNLGAIHVVLSDEDFAQVESAVPPA